MKNVYRHTRRHIGLVALLALILALAGVLAPATAQPGLAQDRADSSLVVTIWPTPSVQVARGDVLTYQVLVKNFDRTSKSNVRIYIPYDANQLTIMNAEFTEGSDGWVSELSPVHVLVTFPEIGGGQSYVATISTRVANNLPDDTVITTWPSYSWSDSRTQSAPKSANAAPVVVGASNIASPFVWMAAQPQSGTQATTFNFFSDRFMPFEPVQSAIVLPDGTTYDIELRGRADDHGRIWLGLEGRWLQPGSYELEVRGLASNLRARAPFTITP
jgi:hypothetical protein